MHVLAGIVYYKDNQSKHTPPQGPSSYYYAIVWWNRFTLAVHFFSAAFIFIRAFVLGWRESDILVPVFGYSSPTYLFGPEDPCATLLAEHTYVVEDESPCIQIAPTEWVIPDMYTTDTEVSITALVGLFAALSFAGQLYWAIFADEYIRFLINGGVNGLRYIEYSFSASAMFVLFLLATGVNDWVALVTTTTCVWACMWFGFLADILLHNGPVTFTNQWFLRKPWWLAHACGWVCMAVPYWVWWHGMLYDGVSIDSSGVIVTILVFQAILFNCFGLTQLFFFLYYEWSGGRGGAAAELAYTFLSLSSKSMLLWAIYIFVLTKSE